MIKVERLQHKRLQGYELKPKEFDATKTIIVFGGSEGSCQLDFSYQLASEGFHVLALFYFGQPYLAPTLDNVELDFFDDCLAYLGKKEISLIGFSRGTELAQLLAHNYKEIINLILFSPSNYFFCGENNGSSWQFAEEKMPYIHFSPRVRLKAFLKRYSCLRDAYLDELTKREELKSFETPIATFKGQLLLFSGEDDFLWPSQIMAHDLGKRAILAKSVKHTCYANAGHSFTFFDDGGSRDGNSFAYLDSMNQIVTLLKKEDNII